MQVDVRQQRAHYSTLRGTTFRVPHHSFFHDSCSQPLSDHAPDHSVPHPLVQKAPQMVAFDLVEEALDVQVDHPASPVVHQSLPQRLKRLVSSTPRPKSVRTFQEVLLVRRFQHHQDRPLQDLVLQRRYPDRARLASRFRQVYPAHRRRPIASRVESVEQALQVLRQIRFVLLGGYSVHPCRRTLSRAPVCLLQPLRVDLMRQRRQHHLRCLPCQFRYRDLFR